MWKYSRGHFDYNTVRKSKYSVFKALRVNSLKKGAARHVQPSSDRVNINHRWNIFHSPDTFYLIRPNLKEGKVKLTIIVLSQSVQESSNDAGMPWISNKCYFNPNLLHGHTKIKRKNSINLYCFFTLRNWLLLYAAVRGVNQLQRMQQ